MPKNLILSEKRYEMRLLVTQVIDPNGGIDQDHASSVFLRGMDCN